MPRRSMGPPAMSDDEQVLALADYLGVLRRRWGWVAICVVVTVASALAWSLTRIPIYQAATEVAVEPFRPAEDASLEEIILGDVTVNTERQVMTSRAVTEAVTDALSLETGSDELLERVTVSVIPDTRVLRLQVTDEGADRAADIANGYADAFLQFRRDQAVASLVAAQETLAARQSGLREQLDDVEQELDDLPAPGSPDDDAATRSALQSERERLLSQLGQVSSRLAEVEADEQLLKGGGQVLTPAQSSDEPVSPQPVRTGVLAVVLGLLLGVGVAFLRDHLDDVIRDEDDAKRAVGDLAILGRIPSGPQDEQRLVTLVDPHAPQAEAYRGLSAAVRFLLAARRESGFSGDGDAGAASGHSVLVTSPDPGDGKTSTATNLAVAAARAGMRVVLVGADMRRPQVHARFGLPAGTGLSDVIAAEVPIREALVDVGIDNLWVLPAGTVPPNSADLLASSRMRALGRFLAAGADLVVVDVPPVLAVADTLEMAPHADATIVVVRANHSRRRNLHHALERLDGVGARVSGLVVNDLDEKSAAYAYYTQSYGKDGDPAGEESARASMRPASTSSSFGLLPDGNGNEPTPAGSGLPDPNALFPLGHDRG